MSEVSVQNFIIDIYISLKRIKKGIFLKSTDKMVIDIARWTDSIVAVELAKLINDELTIEMKDQEIVSLSIHLAAKRIICHFDESIHRIDVYKRQPYRFFISHVTNYVSSNGTVGILYWNLCGRSGYLDL